MQPCDYCDQSFESDGEYLDHLAAAHSDELGPIDQRRVEQHESPSSGRGIPNAVLYGSGVVLVIVLLGWISFGSLLGNSDAGHIHEHGQLTVTINEEPINFDQPQYHETDPVFHIHPGQGNIWHMHPDRVDLEYAMDALTIPVTETTVTVDGTTYDGEDPDTSVELMVNDEPVTIDYELHDGDHIQIIIETTDS